MIASEVRHYVHCSEKSEEAENPNCDHKEMPEEGVVWPHFWQKEDGRKDEKEKEAVFQAEGRMCTKMSSQESWRLV